MATPDLSPVYARHRCLVQLLQGRKPARRWVVMVGHDGGGLPEVQILDVRYCDLADLATARARHAGYQRRDGVPSEV